MIHTLQGNSTYLVTSALLRLLGRFETCSTHNNRKAVVVCCVPHEGEIRSS